LSPAEKEAFLDLVGSLDPKHFEPSDLPLVTSYATSITQEREAVRRLNAEGYIVSGRPSPWITIAEKAHKQMLMLSLRLRLSPQGRSRGTKVKPDRAGAYERLGLAEKDDDVAG
jgi:phage terminase small subunit